MRDVGIQNENIYQKYQKIMTTVNESKKGYRRKVQLLDDRIDDLIDDIEKRIQKEEENPVYQRKLFQLLADMTKEHGEFLMAIKRIASTIDSGAKTIPQAKGSMQPNTIPGDDSQVPDQGTSQDQQPAETENSVNEAGDQTKIALAFAKEALQSILNVEGAARIGAQSGALKGLDWKKPFNKVRQAIKKIEKVK